MRNHLQLVHILAKNGLVLSIGAGNFIHMNRLEKYLRELREQKRLKQEDVAELLNVSPSTYSRWERGEKELSLSEMERVSRILCGDELALYAFLASPLVELSPYATVTVNIYDSDTYEEFLQFLSKRNPKSIGLFQKKR